MLVKGRSVGSITGCRLAGALAVAIMSESIVACQDSWKVHSILPDVSCCVFLCWVDNMFAAAKTLAGSISILESIESHLARKWGLQIKPSSRSCIVPEGSLARPDDPEKWPLVECLLVLGHVLQRNSGISEDWQRVRKNLWKGFWSNAGCKQPVSYTHLTLPTTNSV